MQSVLVLVLGLVVGALSGVIGIGGGVLIVPALVYLLGVSQHRAQGTSLAALLAPVGSLGLPAVPQSWECRRANCHSDRDRVSHRGLVRGRPGPAHL